MNGCGLYKEVARDDISLTGWADVSKNKKLSEDFIRENVDNINWNLISRHQKLSENFIRDFSDKVNWYCISKCQKLSEDFIREFANEVEWCCVSKHQKLSEEFIREFAKKVNWCAIVVSQKLSEPFIIEFSDRINWTYVARYQNLSEKFIKENFDKFDWGWIYVSIYQKLSESFIRELGDKIDNWNISKYQKLSDSFRKEFNINVPKNNWLYKSKEDKLEHLKEIRTYEIIDNKYIIAYKSCREDGTSKYNFKYQYKVGETYEAHCDCNLGNSNSFGLSAWTKEKALKYCDEKLFKVKIDIDDVGAIVQENNKIRCFRLTVLEEVIVEHNEIQKTS